MCPMMFRLVQQYLRGCKRLKKLFKSLIVRLGHQHPMVPKRYYACIHLTMDLVIIWLSLQGSKDGQTGLMSVIGVTNHLVGAYETIQTFKHIVDLQYQVVTTIQCTKPSLGGWFHGLWVVQNELLPSVEHYRASGGTARKVQCSKYKTLDLNYGILN